MARWFKKLKKEWETDFEKNNPRQAATVRWLNSERAQAGVLGFFLMPLLCTFSWVCLVGFLWLVVLLLRGAASGGMSILEAYIWYELIFASMGIAVLVGLVHGLAKWFKATRRRAVREEEEIRLAVRQQRMNE